MKSSRIITTIKIVSLVAAVTYTMLSGTTWGLGTSLATSSDNLSQVTTDPQAPPIEAIYNLPEVSWWHAWSCRSRNQALEQLCDPYEIREAVLPMIHSHHGGALNLGQICDLFDHLQHHWVYVPDPYRAEYFANAKESMIHWRGDCDDFAITLATAIRAIGGLARVVGGYHTEGGHAYAQICIGQTSLLRVDQYLCRRYGMNPHHTFEVEVDQWGNQWLNLDSTYDYPGGPLFEAQSRFLFILGHPNYCLQE